MKIKPPSEPSAVVIPFGKHKGATVAELLTKDPTYADWIANQGWVAERFAELHAAIMARGATTDDSPEHNAIQVRFLDDNFRLACLLAAYPDFVTNKRQWLIDVKIGPLQDAIDAGVRYLKYIEDEKTLYNPSGIEKKKSDIASSNIKRQIKLDKIKDLPFKVSTTVKFEDKGVDVVIYWNIDGTTQDMGGIAVEIKPTMGDDFPSVMRQMARLGSRVLVVGEYHGRAVSEPQLRQMFAANNLSLIFIRDIEAELANARAELA